MSFFKKFMSGANDPPPPAPQQLALPAAPVVPPPPPGEPGPPPGEPGLADSILSVSQHELMVGASQALPQMPAIENQGAFGKWRPPAPAVGMVAPPPYPNAKAEMLAKATRQEAAHGFVQAQAGQQPSLPGLGGVNFANTVAPPRGVIVAPPKSVPPPPGLGMLPRAPGQMPMRPPMTQPFGLQPMDAGQVHGRPPFSAPADLKQMENGQMFVRAPMSQPPAPQQFIRPGVAPQFPQPPQLPQTSQPPQSLQTVPAFAKTHPPSPVPPLRPRLAGRPPGGLPNAAPRVSCAPRASPPLSIPGIPGLPGLPPVAPGGLSPMTGIGLPPAFPSGAIPSVTPGKIKKSCAKFEKGCCLLGDDCPFTHYQSSPSAVDAPAPPPFAPPPAPDGDDEEL